MSETIAEQTIQVLTFELGKEVYGIDISSVREVLEQSNLTKVPQMPAYISGVINLRGHAVPVVDMNKKFYNKMTEKTVDTCIIITEVTMGEDIVVIGALVDSVDEVISFDAFNQEPPPKLGSQLKTDFIKCMAKKDEHFAIILDVNKVFSGEEIAGISDIS
ncbi:MAG: chemotaxis protein CheW [Denitrovibrio sp.]|nr:MAG: chemotaxis protein CheW [Denitrovibrio sp.]